VGVDPETMVIKKLNDFLKTGRGEDAVRMSFFIQYEERRKIKLAMLEEFDKERHELKKHKDSGYLDPNSVYKSKK
jgi:hypothetical protein